MSNLIDRTKGYLIKNHQFTPLTTYLKEIVYGGNDGIVTTFAIVAGFAGAQVNPSANLPLIAVLLFGFANLFADGVSMALGNFLSTQSEQDVYRRAKQKENQELTSHPEAKKLKSMAILVKQGFSQNQAEELVAIYSTNTTYWIDFMISQELELPNPEHENSILMALATFLSFLLFGFIPLIPYVFFKDSATFATSMFATLIALLILGGIRWRVGRQGILRSVGEILLLGFVASAVAYLVGTRLVTG